MKKSQLKQLIKEEIYKILNENKKIISKYNVHLNDQMIDWSSGLNFYTCLANKKHFLPIFAKKNNTYRNAINLSEKNYVTSDYFKITANTTLCKCGKYRCDFTFLPHKKNYIPELDYQETLSWSNILTKEFRSFQIIKNRDNFEIFYKLTEGKLPIYVLEFFENKLKNVLWQKNQTFKIGGKIPPIWNTQYNIPL